MTNKSERHSAKSGHFVAGPQLQEPVNCGLHEVNWVGTTMYLGENICDPAGLQHFANARTGLDAGARSGRDEDHLTRSVFTDHAMGDGVAAERNLLLPLDVTFTFLDCLFDGRRHFVGLAVTVGDLALPVAHH